MPRIARTMALALGLVGAVAASQGPEFAQQYRQRIGGAIDELRRVVARFDADAAAVQQTRETALSTLQANPDRLVSLQAEAMRDHLRRLDRLEGQQRRLAEAAPFQRLAVFLAEIDPELARNTFRDYEPAVPTTGEGLVTAGMGFLVFWGGTLLLAHTGRRLRRGRPRTA